MAEKFTRSWLTETLGLEPDVVKQIMARHVGVTDALKEQIADSDEQAEKLTKVQAELDKLKASHKETADALKAAEKERDEIKGKYDTATADLEKLKTDNAERETTEKSKKALSDYLKEQKYSDHAIRFIRNKGDFHKSIEFDENGKATNLADVLKGIQADEDFSGFTPKVTETSHTPATPPANTGGTKPVTWDDVDSIKDIGERHAFMAQHKDELKI